MEFPRPAAGVLELLQHGVPGRRASAHPSAAALDRARCVALCAARRHPDGRSLFRARRAALPLAGLRPVHRDGGEQGRGHRRDHRRAREHAHRRARRPRPGPGGRGRLRAPARQRIHVRDSLAMSEKRTLPIVIVGHVDHGKSTLIGRLLHDTGSLPEGKVAALQEASRKRGMPFEWSFVMDALKVERDQGITIDTTRMRFRSERRDYVIIDAPGHAEFLKNMLTGAAAAAAAILVIDVIEGMSEQTRRHAFLLKLLGIREIVVAVNKMDRCGYAEAAFAAALRSVADYLGGLGLAASAIIPISARNGDMIAHHSALPSWYHGPTVLQALDALAEAADEVDRPLRLPVQDVYKFDNRRIIVGRIESGRLRVGDRLCFSPGGRSARIASLERWNARPEVSAGAGQSIGLTLDDEIFIERGQVASAPDGVPSTATRLKLRLFHFGHVPLQAGDTVKLQIGLAEQAATVEAIDSVVDINDLSHRRAAAVSRNDIADIIVRCGRSIAVETEVQCRPLGRGILRRDHHIVAGFLVE